MTIQKKLPIIMSAPMILGLLAKRKTQTRRTRGLERFTSRGEPHGYGFEQRRWGVRFYDSIPDDPVPDFEPCPYGGPGDLLWVREGVRHTGADDGTYSVAQYIADGAPAPIDSWGWRNKALPAIHMPAGVSRFTLELEDVRVERLNAITEVDARAEGLEPRGRGWGWPGAKEACSTALAAYQAGWEWLNGDGSWWRNPWVWVLTFKQVG